jgi:hypothetical protein
MNVVSRRVGGRRSGLEGVEMVGTECRTSRRPFTMVRARYLQGVKALGALPGGTGTPQAKRAESGLGHLGWSTL